MDNLPASITLIDRPAITRTQSPNVVRVLTEQTPSVTTTESSGNAFQPDVVFRGFVASPVSGTPEGLAVYQNGVRINEAFGDTVNWDLIPTVAIRDISVVTNNPAFGLNALRARSRSRCRTGSRSRAWRPRSKAARSAGSGARSRAASRSGTSRGTSRSKASTRTGSGGSRPSTSAAFTATSATGRTEASTTSTSGWPTTSSATPPPRRSSCSSRITAPSTPRPRPRPTGSVSST